MTLQLPETVINKLMCPQTGSSLFLDESGSKLLVENLDLEYPIENGIINFLTEGNKYRNDYYAKRAIRYEKIIKKPGLFIRAFDKVVWGIKHEDYAPKVINYIPDNFKGILLDVPVGTGIFPLEKYQRISNALKFVADYSINMLKLAKKRFENNGIKNVIFLHADVYKLPFFNNTVDLVISMNGFHAFINKNKALEEISRISKKRSQFIGCFYIKGEKKITDLVVKRYYSRKGWFLPPFYNYNEFTNQFSTYFNLEETLKCNSMLMYKSFKK